MARDSTRRRWRCAAGAPARPVTTGTPGPGSRRLRERVGGRMAAKTAGSRTGGAAVEAGDRGQRPEALPARASRRRRMGDARDGLRVDRAAVPHPRSRRHVCGSRGRWVGLPRTSERTSRVAVSVVGGGRRDRHGTGAMAAGGGGAEPVPLEGDLGERPGRSPRTSVPVALRRRRVDDAMLGVCAAEKIGPNIKWNAALLTTTCSSRSCRKSSYGADS